jgi:hypothetical protein
MQTLRAVGLKRLSAMDWIGATAATEDATIYAGLAGVPSLQAARRRGQPRAARPLSSPGWLSLSD